MRDFPWLEDVLSIDKAQKRGSLPNQKTKKKKTYVKKNQKIQLVPARNSADDIDKVPGVLYGIDLDVMGHINAGQVI